MELNVAVRLIKRGVDKNSEHKVWADLGSGKGLFTQALATLLSGNSKIYAVDKDGQPLQGIEPNNKDVTIEKIRKDFVYDDLGLEPLDGIIMANAFHFVEDKTALMTMMRKLLKPAGRIIFVEYDTDQSNPWVPYPISFLSLLDFAKANGIHDITKLDEEPSIYDHAEIYSAVLKL